MQYPDWLMKAKESKKLLQLQNVSRSAITKMPGRGLHSVLCS